MSSEKIDLRTPREEAYDRECQEIADRFRELMEYSPSVSRAMERIAMERRTHRETIRHRLVRCGAYQPGTRAGKNNGNQIIDK